MKNELKATKRAFTIVELVIVIAVVAILAAVMIPSFSMVARKARISVVKSNERNIKVLNVIDDILNGRNVYARQVKTLSEEDQTLEFDFEQEGVDIASLSIPREAIKDSHMPVTATIVSIEPYLEHSADEVVYAYDIEVSNLRDDVSDAEAITVTLASPRALPHLKVYHKQDAIEGDYDALNGTVTFTTKSFSPFAMSYIEKTANTLAELREYTAIDNAYVKIGADIEMNFDDYKEWDAETLRANMAHAISISGGQKGVWDVPGYEQYRVAFCGVYVYGKNVTVDLNGHELLLTGHPKPLGAMFFVMEGTLNLTDSVGTGRAKVANSTCIVWSAWTRNTGTYINIYDGIYMADTFTGDTNPTYGYKSNFNTAMIYAGYNDEQYGCINVYGGYFLYNNFPSDAQNWNNGAFNVGDKTTRVCLTVHEGVMLINEHWRQSTGTDDDSVALAPGCKVVPVTLSTPKVIEGVSYANWYQVVTDTPSFEKVFKNTDTYLYRLGNGNNIKLGSLFTPTSYHSAIADSATIDVTITTVQGNVSGVYTAAATASAWADGTIKFSGTGLAKISINGCELLVEVVDGKNVTKQSEINQTGNIILLNDISFTSIGNYVLDSKTLFGNGFTINYNGFGKKTEHVQGVIDITSATLDNVKIIGDEYSTFNDTSSAEYYAAAVVARGNSKIINSYISNCQVAVRTEANSLLVENTTLYGGRYANMQVKGGTVTLRNVATVQEKKVINGTTCLGFGVVVWEDAGASTRIIVEGTLTQNNWATRNDKNYLPGTAKTYAETAFGYSQFVYTYNGTEYVNLGIVSISSNVLSDKIIIPDSINYSKQDASGRACVVTSDKNKNGSLLSGGIPAITEWTPTQQGAYVPTFDWSYPQGYNETSNEIAIAFEQGESYTLNPNFLTATKHDHSLPVSVSMNGTNYTNSDINFTTSGNYTLTYTVTDGYNYGANGSAVATESYTFTVGVNVIVNAPDVKHAEFSYTSGSGTRTVEIGGKTYVMPNVNGTSDTIASKTIGGVTVYMPIVTAQYKNNTSDFDAYSPIFTAINITDYSPATSAGVATTYSKSTKTMPSNLIYTGTGATAPHLNSAGTKDGPMTYSSYGLCYRGVKGADISASTQTVEYCYTDNAGQAYYYYIQYSFPAHKKPTSCFTPDTLITLADGTQKRVDQLTFADKIMVWDFFTGTYAAQSITLLVNHGEDVYDVVYTEYSDGTILKTIADHGVFDYDLNRFVYITAENVQDYVGHRFVKQKLDGRYDIVTLTRGYVKTEQTQAWSITSAATSNAFAQGLLTVAPPEDFYNWIEMSGKLKYDAEQFQKDIETYGLYSYDDFKDHVTYEQFVDWNGAYLKIAVEKGYFTFDYILELIELYKGWMPKG